MEADEGDRLVDELLADPQRFDEEGRAYQLLQCYFSGYPRETLRPLLRSDERLVQKAAAFIISELGVDARDLLDDIVSLMQSGDRYLKYQAMEALTVCADGKQAEKFAYVPLELEDDDAVLKKLAMRLVANADSSQLAAAADFLTRECRWRKHSRALLSLANEDMLTVDEVVRMVRDSDALIRRYGAIAARRLRHRYPKMVSEVSLATEDPDLLDYFREA